MRASWTSWLVRLALNKGALATQARDGTLDKALYRAFAVFQYRPPPCLACSASASTGRRASALQHSFTTSREKRRRSCLVPQGVRAQLRLGGT